MAELAVTGLPDLINPVSGDLALTPRGTFFLRTVLRDEVDQRVRVRLQFFSGQWFLNLSAGTPYFQHILVKGPSDQTIRSVFLQVLSRTEGVKEVKEFSYVLNERTRRLTISFELTLENETPFRSIDFPPFVITA